MRDNWRQRLKAELFGDEDVAKFDAPRTGEQRRFASSSAAGASGSAEPPSRIAKHSAQNGFTDLVEGLFYAIAMTTVGLPATTVALFFRPATFVQEVRGKYDPASPLDLGAAAYFLASLIFTALCFWALVLADAESTFTGDGGQQMTRIVEPIIDSVIAADVNSIIPQMLPAIVAAIGFAVGLRAVMFFARGTGTFDQALRVCLYTVGAVGVLVGLSVVLLAGGNYLDSQHSDLFNDTAPILGLDVSIAGVLISIILGLWILTPLVLLRVLFSLGRRSFGLGRIRGLGAIAATLALWTGGSFAAWPLAQWYFSPHRQEAETTEERIRVLVKEELGRRDFSVADELSEEELEALEASVARVVNEEVRRARRDAASSDIIRKRIDAETRSLLIQPDLFAPEETVPGPELSEPAPIDPVG